MVSVLAIEREVREFIPSQGDGFLRVRSTRSFGREVKPEAPCRKILRNVKNHLTRIKNTSRRPSL
jgi:hypothetical protein